MEKTILRGESKIAMKYLTPHIQAYAGREDFLIEDILGFLTTCSLVESTFSEDRGDHTTWIDVYNVEGRFIRAMVPYTKETYEVLPIKSLDLNSLQEVYPKQVLVTKYRTLTEIEACN